MTSDAQDQAGDSSQAADETCIRWRPWPCASCRGGATPLDFLVSCFGSIPQIPHRDRNCQIDWQKKWESDRLLGWVKSCPHTQWTEERLPHLKTGSEHCVLFDEAAREVVKITLPGIYGDYYEIIDDQVTEFRSTPAEYLIRMHWWDELFSTAPVPLGMTEAGQFVSRQRFIVGDAEPPQARVDQFLIDAGATEVRRRCWLWKFTNADPEIEIWIGDARSDNFVLAGDQIVPIDIRVWGVPVETRSSQPNTP
jgi:hypothetical protein